MNAIILYNFQLICPECGISLCQSHKTIWHPLESIYAPAATCSQKGKIYKVPTIELTEITNTTTNETTQE